MTKVLNLEDILKIQDAKEIEVDMTRFGWNGSVMLRRMTAEARDAYELSVIKSTAKGYEEDHENIRAKLVAACAIDANGKRMFTSEAHIKALGNKAADAIDYLFNECKKLNAISSEDIDELAGN